MALTKTEIIVGGNTYDVSDRDNYLHLSDEGHGMAPSQRKYVAGPNQDGVTDVGFQLQPRIIAVQIGAFADDPTEHYAFRDQLLRIFVPQEASMLYRRTLPDGAVRQLDCHFAGELTFGSGKHRGDAMIDVVALKASDPTWWEPTLRTFSAGPSGGSELVFPIDFPISFSSSIINEGIAIGYTGSWKAYPTIKLVGPMANPIITNNEISQSIQLLTTIASGVEVTIELTPGSKQIYDDQVPSNNLIGTLSTDSDLSTFHLAAPLDGTAQRINNFQLSAGSMTPGVSTITIEYYNRYVGI